VVHKVRVVKAEMVEAAVATVKVVAVVVGSMAAETALVEMVTVIWEGA